MEVVFIPIALSVGIVIGIVIGYTKKEQSVLRSIDEDAMIREIKRRRTNAKIAQEVGQQVEQEINHG